MALHLLHHLHDDGPGSRQDQVADGAVVVREDVQPVHRHHELTHLDTQRRQDRCFGSAFTRK